MFADVGFDATGRWSREVLDQLAVCHAFLPNAGEAMAYTRSATPTEALYTLAGGLKPMSSMVAFLCYGIATIGALTALFAALPWIAC